MIPSNLGPLPLPSSRPKISARSRSTRSQPPSARSRTMVFGRANPRRTPHSLRGSSRAGNRGLGWRLSRRARPEFGPSECASRQECRPPGRHALTALAGGTEMRNAPRNRAEARWTTDLSDQGITRRLRRAVRLADPADEQALGQVLNLLCQLPSPDLTGSRCYRRMESPGAFGSRARRPGDLLQPYAHRTPRPAWEVADQETSSPRSQQESRGHPSRCGGDEQPSSVAAPIPKVIGKRLRSVGPAPAVLGGHTLQT